MKLFDYFGKVFYLQQTELSGIKIYFGLIKISERLSQT